MNPRMLQIQQYVRIHPITNKSLDIRKKYLTLLCYFVGRQGSGNLWSKQTLKLYSDVLVGDSIDDRKGKTRDLSFLEKNKLFKYRFYLLTDCLFVRCFDDKKRGLKVVDDVVEFYGDRYTRKIKRLYDAFYSNNDEKFLLVHDELREIYEIIWRNRSFISEPIKRLMITANMSAGKSTLLNALAGKRVSKTQSEACTAKLHFLYNKAGEDGLDYELDHDLVMDASLEILMTDNVENDSAEIVVGTRFRSIEEIDYPICFIDTPGVNFSIDKRHREISNSAIEAADCDLLIYLINGENPGSDDEIKHMKFVKEHYDGDIIFLINRVDRYKKNVDSVKNTLEGVKNDLVKIGFCEPIVYPVSAYAGYLGKMALYGEMLSEDEQDDMEFVKRKLQKEDFSYEKYYPVDIDVKCRDTELGELLLHSGILSLEKLLYQGGSSK